MIYASRNILGNRFIHVVRVRGRNGSQDEQKTGQFQAAVCYFSISLSARKCGISQKVDFFFWFMTNEMYEGRISVMHRHPRALDQLRLKAYI